MQFHMLMLMNDWMMLMLMQMQAQYASLTPRVLQPFPLTEISPQDLQCLPFFIKFWVDLS